MQTVPQGLATIAFLKTRLDQGIDHISLPEPLVRDAIGQLTTKDFSAVDIREIVKRRAGIELPTSIVQTLLKRLIREGQLELNGGRYFLVRPNTTSSAKLDAAWETNRQRLEHLGESLKNFADDSDIALASAEVALESLCAFVAENKVPLSLANRSGNDLPQQVNGLSKPLSRTIAKFIQTVCLADSTLESNLEALVEGLIIRDVLLLTDLGTIERRFQNLTVAIDTVNILAALGLTGKTNEVPARESIELIRRAGGRVVVFSGTILEVRSILNVYIHKLGSTGGRLSLYPTALTQHLLETKQSPTDVQLIAGTLEKRLERLAVQIVDPPEYIERYTIDEDSLSEALRDYRRSEQRDAQRIFHDVRCVSAVMTMRSGQRTRNLEDCVSVFCSSSVRVVSTIQTWYRAKHDDTIPPIIHQQSISNIAWVKSPTAIPGSQMHELAAVCQALVAPSRETWLQFTETLKDLLKEGHITDDETAAIVTSTLVAPSLSAVDEMSGPAADNVLQAIERIRVSIREEATADFADEIQNRDLLASKYKTEAYEAKGANVRTLSTVLYRVKALSKAIRIAIQALLGLLTISAVLYFTIASVMGNLTMVPQLFIVVLAIVFGLLSVLSLITGSNVYKLARSTEVAIQRWLYKKFTGMDLLDVDAK